MIFNDFDLTTDGVNGSNVTHKMSKEPHKKL